MSGFPSGKGNTGNNPIMLGQSVALIGQPVSGDFLPVGSTVNRSDYPTLSDTYPNLFSLQKTTVAIPASYPWSGVAYGNGVYVAVGGGCGRASGYDGNTNTQSVFTSTDGITWTAQSNVLPASHYWSGIAFGNGVFVVCSNTVAGNVVAYSTDGISWSSVSMSSAYYGVAFGNGIFVVFGNGTVCATSSNGVNWTNRSYGDYTTTWGCNFVNGKFWRATTATALQYSTDGISWGTITLPTAYWGNVVWNGSMFLISATNSTTYATSTNGATWTTRTMPASLGCAGVIDKMFVVFSGNTGTTGYYSTNGMNWTAFAAYPKVFCLFPDNSRLIIFPQNYSSGYIYTYGQSTTISLIGTAGQYVRVR